MSNEFSTDFFGPPADFGCGRQPEPWQPPVFNEPWKPAYEPPVINGRDLSPVHWSPENGVHADLGHGRFKEHIPFEGQTTLPTFRIGGRPDYENDLDLADLGGTYRPW